MWEIVCVFAFMIMTRVTSEQKPKTYNVRPYEELNLDREALQRAYYSEKSQHYLHFKSFGRIFSEKMLWKSYNTIFVLRPSPQTDYEDTSRTNMDYNWRKQVPVSTGRTSDKDKLINTRKENSERLHLLNRPKRLAPKNGSSGYTCNLYLLSDLMLWRHITRDMSQGRTDIAEFAKQQILALFSRHVSTLNEIFLKTTFNTYDNSLSYSGISFNIARTQIMTDVTEKCGQRDATPWCNSSTTVEQVLKLFSKENHDAFCLAYVFTHRMGIPGLSYYADDKAAIGGICNKFNDGFNGNTGLINLYRLQPNVSHFVFAHEMGHSFGSTHDRGSMCLPAGNSERYDYKGNFLMSPGSVYGNKPLNNQFSPCSRDRIARVLDAVISERYNKTNCFTEEPIIRPFKPVITASSSPVSAHTSSTSTSATRTSQHTDAVSTNTPRVDPSGDRVGASLPNNHTWTIGLASTVIVMFVCLAVVFPYVLWKRRVVFLMKLVHRFQTYEDVDEREFDAFISYRSTEVDEHFVVHTLFPKLEKQFKFKICVHFRDFMPGETIANNIIWGVESSRRTIMVLTPSYIKSEFCRFEYQRAQHEMLKQKQRIIPIILKDISSATNDMDETLRTILSSITYIEWPGSDDKRKLEIFWEKLILSMPKLHRNSIHVQRSSSKIDDTELMNLNAKNGSTEKSEGCLCACV